MREYKGIKYVIASDVATRDGIGVEIYLGSQPQPGKFVLAAFAVIVGVAMIGSASNMTTVHAMNRKKSHRYPKLSNASWIPFVVKLRYLYDSYEIQGHSAVMLFGWTIIKLADDK